MINLKFVEFIKHKGYEEYPYVLSISYPEIQHQTFYKKINTKIFCNCNERQPQFCVEYIVFNINGDILEFIEISITAETSLKEWINFKYYSLKPDNVEIMLEKTENSLLKAWEACNI